MPGPDRIEWGLVIHGGVGVLPRSDLTPELDTSYRESLSQSLRAGHKALVAGKGAVGAVVAAVQVMEDSPLYNAGRGSNLDSEGRVTMDAAIMRGVDLAAGAVAEVTTVRSPIELARLVMDRSPSVFLVGEGAEEFAADQGVPATPNGWFVTERRIRARADAEAREAKGDRTPNVIGRPADVPLPEDRARDFSGTVGAVALDSEGLLCAGTSTGGMANKKFGRIGDSPVIGAGTYASPRCGVSCTGWGEYFIRNAVAHDVDARMEYLGASLSEAVDQIIQGKLERQRRGLGGLVALDAAGAVVMGFNTAGMYRGWIDQDGALEVGIF